MIMLRNEEGVAGMSYIIVFCEIVLREILGVVSFSTWKSIKYKAIQGFGRYFLQNNLDFKLFTRQYYKRIQKHAF